MDLIFNSTPKEIELESFFALTQKEIKMVIHHVFLKFFATCETLDWEREKTIHDYNPVKTFFEKVLAYRRCKFNKRPNKDNQRMLRQATFAMWIVMQDLDHLYANAGTREDTYFYLSDDEMSAVECNVNMRFTNLEHHLTVDEFMQVKDCVPLEKFYAKVHDCRRQRFYERPNHKSLHLLRQAIYAQFFLNKRLDTMRMNEYSE
jgi:head-tail adaptor